MLVECLTLAQGPTDIGSAWSDAQPAFGQYLLAKLTIHRAMLAAIFREAEHDVGAHSPGTALGGLIVTEAGKPAELLNISEETQQTMGHHMGHTWVEQPLLVNQWTLDRRESSRSP